MAQGFRRVRCMVGWRLAGADVPGSLGRLRLLEQAAHPLRPLRQAQRQQQPQGQQEGQH